MSSLDTLKSHLKSIGTYRIVFLGDSITSAEWVHPNWREIIEYVLKEELQAQLTDWKIPSWGIRCINSGFDGASTKDLLNKMYSDVIAFKPNLLVIMATSNDIFSDIKPTEHKLNIKKIIDMVYSEDCKVVYCTDICSANNDYNGKYVPYLEEVKSLFPYREVMFINTFEEMKKYSLDKMFTFTSSGNDAVGIKSGEIDFIHPNQLGNAYIAKILLKEIFDVAFDPENYIKETNEGKMFPSY